MDMSFCNKINLTRPINCMGKKIIFKCYFFEINTLRLSLHSKVVKCT